MEKTGGPVRLIRYIETRVWPRQGPAEALVSAALLPAAALFRCAVAVRNAGYSAGVLRSRRADIPVISVGNLAVGGSGKTPLALWLGSRLLAAGRRPALIHRGYGGRRHRGVRLVGRDGAVLERPADVGDEAVLLAKRFSGPVLVARRRLDAVMAAREMGCDCAILDDGFQHRALARDVDVVLVGERRERMLPAGPFREPLRALRRADAVVAVGDRLEESWVRDLRRLGGTPVFPMQLVATAAVEPVGSRWLERPLALIAGRRAVAVAGIARADRFFATLHRWDVLPADVFQFPDHHAYSADDWRRILRAARGADLVLTTEKDLVKLETFPFASGTLLAIRVEPVFEDEAGLLELVLARLDAQSVARSKRKGGRDVDQPGTAGDLGVSEVQGVGEALGEGRRPDL